MLVPSSLKKKKTPHHYERTTAKKLGLEFVTGWSVMHTASPRTLMFVSCVKPAVLSDNL